MDCFVGFRLLAMEPYTAFLSEFTENPTRRRQGNAASWPAARRSAVAQRAETNAPCVSYARHTSRSPAWNSQMHARDVQPPSALIDESRCWTPRCVDAA